MEIITEHKKKIEIAKDQIDIEIDIQTRSLGKEGQWEQLERPIGYVFYKEKGKVGRIPLTNIQGPMDWVVKEIAAREELIRGAIAAAGEKVNIREILKEAKKEGRL